MLNNNNNNKSLFSSSSFTITRLVTMTLLLLTPTAVTAIRVHDGDILILNEDSGCTQLKLLHNTVRGVPYVKVRTQDLTARAGIDYEPLDILPRCQDQYGCDSTLVDLCVKLDDELFEEQESLLIEWRDSTRYRTATVYINPVQNPPPLQLGLDIFKLDDVEQRIEMQEGECNLFMLDDGNSGYVVQDVTAIQNVDYRINSNDKSINIVLANNEPITGTIFEVCTNPDHLSEMGERFKIQWQDSSSNNNNNKEATFVILHNNLRVQTNDVVRVADTNFNAPGCHVIFVRQTLFSGESIHIYTQEASKLSSDAVVAAQENVDFEPVDTMFSCVKDECRGTYITLCLFDLSTRDSEAEFLIRWTDQAREQRDVDHRATIVLPATTTPNGDSNNGGYRRALRGSTN